MSHEIQKPYDLVLSTEGTEWHGLAEHVESITEENAAPLLFPIVEGRAMVEYKGQTVFVPNRKVLVADLSARIGMKEIGHPDYIAPDNFLVPMHTPKDTYKVISNGAVWENMKRTIEGFGGTVTTVGTLGGCAKFFVSVRIGDAEFTVNKDKFLSHLNFITSHDGTLAMQAYDSNIRIVCMNTLRWSLNAAGDAGFRVYHTEGAEMKMDNFADFLNSIMLGRKEFARQAEMFENVSLTRDQALYFALAFMARHDEPGSKAISTRSYNVAEGIVNLFGKAGKGNKGATFYDLMNGATEFWTHGDGTGKKSDALTKAWKSEFASAAELKSEFVEMIGTSIAQMSTEESFDKGRQLYVEFNKSEAGS